MPTPKEVSKIKQDWIAKRKAVIDSKLNQVQEEIYNGVIADFLALAKQEEIRNQSSKLSVAQLNLLERQVKKGMLNGFPDAMKETIKASRALGDLNLMYFSTLVDSNRLDDLKDKNQRIIDKRLGVDENGKLIKDGFTDKTIKSDKVQKEFITEVRRILGQNGDVQMLQARLKTLILGGPERGGLVQRYYNTFATNILNTIDRNNNNFYADELALTYFYYGGGLIKTSRSFCVERNGKIFSREQAEKWRDTPFIRKMYGKKISDYDPLTMMGGPGCLHAADWITDELAKGNIREQNKIAATRNDNFKNRNGL